MVPPLSPVDCISAFFIVPHPFTQPTLFPAFAVMDDPIANQGDMVIDKDLKRDDSDRDRERSRSRSRERRRDRSRDRRDRSRDKDRNSKLEKG